MAKVSSGGPLSVDRQDSFILTGLKPSRLIFASEPGDTAFESIGHTVGPPALANVLIDPRTRALLGVCYDLTNGELASWCTAGQAALGCELVTLESLRYGFGTERDDPRTPACPGLVIRWARSTIEGAEVGQLVEARWLASRDAEDESVDVDVGCLGLFAFVMLDLPWVLEQTELTFPTDLLVDEVVDLRGREHELRSLVLGPR